MNHNLRTESHAVTKTLIPESGIQTQNWLGHFCKMRYCHIMIFRHNLIIFEC